MAMTTNEQRLEVLFDKYIQQSISATEEQELMALLADASLAAKREALIEKVYDNSTADFSLTPEQSDSIFTAIIQPSLPQTRQAPIVKFQWKRWAVAASILAAIAFGGYFILSKNIAHQQDESTAGTRSDVKAPATNKAMITLSNGQSIYLDSVANGQLLQQNGIEIVKLADGKIVYKGTTTEVLYNTLTNPRGSKVIDMALADGSHVWLNAGSSISFPLAFVGKERKVSITGEAYFEVAKNAAAPFIVDINGKCHVEVLGTHFNVNAYTDESAIKTTLLEGSVRVTASASKISKLIEPGQQAQLHANDHFTIQKNAPIDEVMAWKNGYLNFNNADLPTVMRKLERWYNIQVMYEGEVPRRSFGGEIQNSLTLSQVLHILEKNNVRFKVDGNKLIVNN
ncbi:MAG: DUF4974 domain-containing protein [Chitinophagaceae bacterium]|nr:DUF4974 domain-containing protein [Chitinophagaceae bacterium]